MADGTDPPSPGDGRTGLNTLSPRQEGGGLPSRPEEGSLDQDQQQVEEETYFSPREPSPRQDSSEEELRRHRYGRHRSRRGRHHRRLFSPVGKGAAGEVSFPHHMVISSPQQQSLVSERNIAQLNEVLDWSLTEGLTSNIADLLSTLTGRVQIAPSESSSLKIGSSVPSVSSVNTRMTMYDLGAISKFSGNENGKNSILNVMSQYEPFVTASLKSRPGVTEDMIDDLLITYFIFVLNDEAIQFYTQLIGGQAPWRRTADGDRQLSDTASSAKPTSWSEMKTAFEASYLSADALARSVKHIVTLTQGPNESVTSYVNRLRGSFNSLNRQVQKQHIQPVEASQIAIFERGLRPETLELQRIGQYCKSMQQAVDRAQRSAASLAAVDGSQCHVMVDCCARSF